MVQPQLYYKCLRLVLLIFNITKIRIKSWSIFLRILVKAVYFTHWNWISKSMLSKQQPEMFFDKGVTKISENSQEYTLVRVSFELNLQVSDVKFYKEKGSMKGGFFWSLLNFWWHLFSKKSGSCYFWKWALWKDSINSQQRIKCLHLL